MARLRGRVDGSLVLDAQGIVKLAGGDRQARQHYEAARRREGHVVTTASTIADVLRGGPLLAAVALGLPRPVVLLTSDPDDMAQLTEEPGRPRPERIAVLRL